jgi:crossover junction endodeoxyribonuclease RuvC
VDGWKEVDARAVATFIRAQREANPGAEVQAALEKVGARPGDGGTSAFRFGDSYGQARAVLQVMGVPYLRAIPAVWKRRFGLIGQDKDAARLLAIQRFPAAAFQLQRKKDNGRADALLIALWAEHQLAMGQAAA